jgi:flagellar hook-length control protein FliK
MAINAVPLTALSTQANSSPRNPAPATPAGTDPADPSRDDPSAQATPGGANSTAAGSGANGGSSPAAKTPDSGAAGAKNAPAAAPTANRATTAQRNVDRGNARLTRTAPRVRATTGTTANVATGTDEAGDQPSDFLTAMATALGQSPAPQTPAAPAAAPASAPATHGATPAAPDPTANAGWLAQVLLPAQHAAAAPSVAAADTGSDAATNDAPATTAPSTGISSPKVLSLLDDLSAAKATSDSSTASTATAQLAAPDAAAPAAAAPTDPSAFSSALAAVQTLAPTQAAAPAPAPTPTHELTIQTPVAAAGWSAELGGQVTLLAHRGIESASLQLTPADLGPIQVHIGVQNGQASVWFSATHTETRSALEQSLPQLREMFSTQGMSLTDAGVFREPPRQQSPTPTFTGSASGGTTEDTTQTVMPVSNLRLSLVDTYA